MSIARETSNLFSSVARERGRDVFHHRAIGIVRGDAWSLTASTLGGSSYLIDLARDNTHHITARCTCSEFANRELCRHIWAALLLAEKKDLLTGPAGRPHRVSLAGDFSSLGQAPAPRETAAADAPVTLLPGSPAVGAVAPESHVPVTWRETLARLRALTDGGGIVSAAYRPTSRQIVYVFDHEASRASQGVILHLGWQDRKTSGDWGRVQTRPYLSHELAGALDTSDAELITVLEGAASSYIREVVLDPPRGVLRNHYHLSPTMLDLLWPRLISTGRVMLRLPGPTPELPVVNPVVLDDGPPWELCLEVREMPQVDAYRAFFRLRRGDDSLVVDHHMTLVKGAVFLHDTIARLDDRGVLAWMSVLRREDGGQDGLTVPQAEGYAFVNEVVALPRVPHLILPESLRLDDTRVAPGLILRLYAGQASDPERPLTGTLFFEYQGHEVSWADTSERLLQQEPRRLLVRDPVIERAALDELTNEGVRVGHVPDGRGLQLELSTDLLPQLVRTLTARGWRVEAGKTRYRAFTGSRFSVVSGIDWFELEGVLEFGDASVSLAALLAACPRGESFVILDDGSVGVVPEDWLARRELLQLCRGREKDHLRFTRGQAVLLDQLLARQPAVQVDEPFARLREALRHFDGVDAADPPDDFHGTLRPYQREGLGWLLYLQEFGFGGCLADDMGLGKTVQVLALLAARRPPTAPPPPPSLVVVPRSLIHNWQEEAARFVPQLRVLDHTGAARMRDPLGLSESDLILTTYGTLLRDAAWLAEMQFDCIVLDEAHAIKNAGSETARSVRMLRGRQRLALTGTPVQNHLGELWSLFDFLNPGLLGSAAAFDRLHGPSGDPESRRILAQTFRPFLLRRTKSQVAADLPPKVEQTIHCQLDGPERDFYDQLRVSFRESILSRIDREGFGRSRMFILEGLLRLRQAACHPGLLDPGRTAENSAKIDMLLERLREIVEEGHKAIVFSQFVKLLDIVRLKLDREGLMYASLDGRTRHRGTVVDQFQRDPSCRIFLISLKAGGLGLNLTAADYVFLLDPWWNPAIEAQAIDRAHRIGQTRQVFAYRLIAQDTIDEKVLELQQRKQELADAVMGKGEDVQRLTREDLERLLS